MSDDQLERIKRLWQLHEAAVNFVIANAWDAGSARNLAGMSFLALATSGGAAAGVPARTLHE